MGIEVITHPSGLIISNMDNMTSVQVDFREFAEIVGQAVLQKRGIEADADSARAYGAAILQHGETMSYHPLPPVSLT